MPEVIYANYHWFDPSGEEMFPLRQPPREIGATYETLRGCALRGVINPLTGGTIFLRVCMIPTGRTIGTTREEYQRFIQRWNSEDSA